MKIEKMCNAVKFGELKCGDVFTFKNSVRTYMKTIEFNSRNAVRLDIGDTNYSFADSDEVIWFPTAKLVIE